MTLRFKLLPLLGIDFARCVYCDNFLDIGDTIPYCDYLCHLEIIKKKKKKD